MSFIVTFAFGQTNFTVNGINYTTTRTNTVQVSQGGTYTGAIIIPSSVTYSGVSYNVTSIGSGAFSWCGLTSVTIPSSVTSIGSGAFESCTGLTSITIPSSVTSIGNDAFSGCSGLTSVTIPSSVTSIGSSAFESCSGLTSVTIPLSVTSIGGGTFADCSGLTSVTIPSSVTSIGDDAFAYCSELTSVMIPSSVITIGDGAFDGCSGFITVDTGSLNYSNLDGVLYNKTKTILIHCPISITGSFIIPSSVTSIGSYAFESCTGLTSVSIQSFITSIGNGAFEGCSGFITVDTGNLNYSSLDGVLYNKTKTLLIQCPTSKTGSFIIPSLVTLIGSGAFEDCSALTSITIPSTVTFIYDYVFQGCSGLTSIIAYPATPVELTSAINVFYNVNKTTCILYVPPFSLGLYQSANQWKDFSNIINILNPITTTQLTNITATTASGGGNIISDGGFTVTARGVCWSTSVNPTIANNKTSDGNGTGTFSSNITGLTPITTYHIRAYATNSTGTAYGDDLTITTLGIPIINTTVASLITGTTAFTGGNISIDGGTTITSRGVCWSTTANPTISNSKTTDGTGTGTFSSKITGLNPDTPYHFRAYATNNGGTAYGSDITFTTLASSTEVYLNNIAFISSAQDGTQLNVPSAMTMNTTNPNNYLNSGNLVRFKMQCFNKKSNGINIVSGSCKVRCNDPYITLTDSTSGLNNVGYNASAWSSDEFEIQINNATPWGYIAYVDFEVIEGSNSYFTYKVPIPIAPLSLQSKTVDDDNNPDSHGNSNGICEPNEIIESLPTLQNVSSLSANTVSGTFGSYYGAASINVWNNKQGSSGTVVNNSYWNFAFGAPQVITAGAKDLLPQWDFVFDYNYTSTYHFTLGLAMSGSFNLFSGYKSFIKWLIPIDYNVGYPDFNTGISDNYVDNIDFYPNPTNGIINIVIGSGNFTNCLFNITNSLGQKVYNSKLYTKKTTLDLTKVSKSGLLYIQIINNKGAVIGEKKILVK